MLSPDPFIQDPAKPQNYNRYSYVLNNPLKFTDPSGYQYMIDGMEVSERAFYNYWKNMSGTEMYIDMVGSWDNAASVWFLQQTSTTESIKEEKVFLTNSVFKATTIAGVPGFVASVSGSRSKLWTGNLGSSLYWTYNAQPESTFWDGDNLYGVFTLKTITKGRLVTIDDMQRGMKMRSEKESSSVDIYDINNFMLNGTNLLSDAAANKQIPDFVGDFANSKATNTASGTLKGVGIGTSVISAGLSYYKYKSIENPTWGDKAELAVGLSSSALSASPPTTLIGISLGMFDVVGGFDGWYSDWNQAEHTWKNYGFAFIPIYNPRTGSYLFIIK